MEIADRGWNIRYYKMYELEAIPQEGQTTQQGNKAKHNLYVGI